MRRKIRRRRCAYLLRQRIALLQSEIERLKAERLKKGDSRAAAEALFR